MAMELQPRTILDVGGEGMLRLFLPQIQITNANVKNADIVYAGDKLPVNDNSFELVVSLDTIEHLPNHKRTDFLYELYRVSRKGFILCAPLGTAEHLAYEKEILNSGILDGDSFAYLSEHGKFGLPSPNEVSEMAKEFSAKVFYQGDFRKVRPSGNRYTYYDLLVQTVSNTLIDAFWQDSKYLKPSFTQYTNRFFLIANKTGDER
jgi:ubiquinone/menaquinone biosynthesis C-methylase UbiE